VHYVGETSVVYNNLCVYFTINQRRFATGSG
jgi:hypothetical protein